MKTLSLKSTIRESIGKGSARSLRRGDLIPAILYGQNVKESVKLTVRLTDCQKIFKIHKTSNFLLDLIIDGIVRKVTIKELQKHPVSGKILHIDFYEVSMNRNIKISVQISTTGICKGVELGGMLQIIRREIEIICLPDNIPESINVNISDLNIGDSFHASDLFLPEGMELYGEDDFTILTILSQKGMSEESESLEEDGLGTSNKDDLDGDNAI